MKSFADWTEELANAVGEVQHHWETRKEAELKADWTAPVLDDGEQPGWPVPDFPPPPPIQLISKCDSCDISSIDVGIWQASTGNEYSLCNSCSKKYNFKRVV